LLVGNELVPGDAEGRSFYEVVSSPQLMQQVCQQTPDEQAAGFS
jgi:hypothetical protein